MLFMLHLRSCCLQLLLTLLVPSHPSPPPHSAANPSQSPVCAQADTDGWCMYQLDLLPYGFRTPAGHSKIGCMGGANLNGGILAAKILWSTLGRPCVSCGQCHREKSRHCHIRLASTLPILTLLDCPYLRFSIETYMHSFADVILWNLMLLTFSSPLCVARKNHNPTPEMGSVTYVAEDHAQLLIRMDLIVVCRHLWQYLELLTSAHGAERLVDTRSAKKKKNLKTCCILSVLRKKTAARDADVTSHLRADLRNLPERLHRRHGHNR